jgi:hypothetical protein
MARLVAVIALILRTPPVPSGGVHWLLRCKQVFVKIGSLRNAAFQNLHVSAAGGRW